MSNEAQLVRDLGNKCADDVQAAYLRAIDLVDTHVERYIVLQYATAGLNGASLACLVKSGLTVEQAKAKLVEQLQKVMDGATLRAPQ